MVNKSVNKLVNKHNINKHKRRGQVWSTDLIAGVLIFLLVVGIFYAFLSKSAQENNKELEVDSQIISNRLTTDDNFSITNPENPQVIDDERLKALVGNLTKDPESYEKVKEELGISGEFCIVLEDEDGNIITVKDSSGNSYAGVGYYDPNSDYNLNLTKEGIICGEQIS